MTFSRSFIISNIFRNPDKLRFGREGISPTLNNAVHATVSLKSSVLHDFGHIYYIHPRNESTSTRAC